MLVHAFDTLKMPVHRSETLDILKKVTCMNLSQAHFLLSCHFYMNVNIENS